MKMSDVFALPVSDQDVGVIVLPCMAEYNSLGDAHVVHAVNHHDALTAALSTLLDAAECEGLDLIGYKKEIKQARDALGREK